MRVCACVCVSERERETKEAEIFFSGERPGAEVMLFISGHESVK